MQEVNFEPRDNDEFMSQLRLLERWHKKSIPQILEKNRPDAAYAIAMYAAISKRQQDNTPIIGA